MHDSRCQENKQLVFLVLHKVTTEQAANKGHITKERYLLHLLALGVGEYATNHYGFSIVDQYLGIDFVFADGRLTIDLVSPVRLILVDPYFHDDTIVRSNLRYHFQRQERLLEFSTGGTVFNHLIGNFHTFHDAGRFLVGGNHLGLGDNLAKAAFFHGTQLQIKHGAAGNKADAQ